MDPRLDNYDWEQVFEYAHPTICEAEHVHGPEPAISGNVSTAPFTRDDVETIIAMEDGTNEESDWIGVFKLKDGRFVYIEAGCDYSGWD